MQHVTDRSVVRHSVLVAMQLVFAAVASITDAAPIHFSFTGTVAGVSPRFSFLPGKALDGTPWSDVEAGDPLEFSFTFDDSTPDSHPSLNLGSYADTISEFSLHIGGASDNVMLMNGSIGVADNEGPWNNLRDYWTVNVRMRNNVSLSITLDDETETAFSSPELPTTLNRAAFSIREFLVHQGNTGLGFIYGSIDVPEPTALLVALMGIAAGLLRRRR